MKKIIVTGKQGKSTYVRKITQGRNSMTFIPKNYKALSEMKRLINERLPEYIVVEEANRNNDFCEMLFDPQNEPFFLLQVVILVMQQVPKWALDRPDIEIVDIKPYNHKEESKKDRKNLLIRYIINEEGLVTFIDPCCDEIPVDLFAKVMKALVDVQKDWNSKVKNRCSSILPDIEYDKPSII